MNALMVCSEFPPGPGGIGRHAHQLALELRRLGWSIAVLTAQDYAAEDEITRFNQSQPFPVTRFLSARGGVLKPLQRAWLISRWMRRWSPDVVIASGQRSAWLLATVIGRTPWLAVAHGTEFGVSSRWERPLVRWAFSKATGVASVSRYTRREMDLLGVAPRSCRVIPNGADPSRFPVRNEDDVRGLRRRMGLEQARILLTVGNVTDRKGQEVVIRAMPAILRRIPEAHYLMAGLPTEKQKLSALAEQLNVSDRVHFLGRVAEESLAGLLSSCDVFVMTSRRTATGDFEGYGIAVVEAACCGVPAVVSDSGGLPEAIADGETGLCVPEGDSHATAEAIATLLADEPRRRAMGEAAKRRAIGEQTWSERARDYDLFLRDLLTGTAAASKKARSSASESML